MIDFLLKIWDILYSGGLLSCFFLYASFRNLNIIFLSRWRKRYNIPMPLVGGLAGALIVYLSEYWKFFWIPMLFDIGCLPTCFVFVRYLINEWMKEKRIIKKNECKNVASIYDGKHGNETKIPDFDFGKATLVKPTFWQVFFAVKHVEFYIFVATFSIITFCFYFFGNSEEEKKALLLLGAFVGCFSAMIFQIKLGAHREKINGWPFDEGNIVQIIKGRHAGKIAQILPTGECYLEQGEVRISIAGEPEGGIENRFRYLELIKLKTSFSKNETTP